MSRRENLTKKAFVVGHKGMVGSAICRKLSSLVNVDIKTVSRQELDLLDQAATHKFFELNEFDEVYLAAARVGGIVANNSYPADFIYQNLMIQSNVIQGAYLGGVKKLLFLGSSCIYPKLADQPMLEDSLLTGLLEPTNEPYAVAKIAGIKLCESYNRQYKVDYRSVMPTNLYGPNDNFHPDNSHVIPAMMRRFHLAKIERQASVEVWGSGRPKREFLYVDELADACVCVMDASPELYQSVTQERVSHINIGTGVDCSIEELAILMKQVTNYSGGIVFDASKPDGAPRKLLNVDRAHELGWQAKTKLKDGLQLTYQWYVNNINALRKA